MADQESEKNLSLSERMEVFVALVEGQDTGMAVARSREAVAARFGLSEQQVRRIEREGLDGGWPPLS